MGGRGWLDQLGIRLTQLSTGLKVDAELGNTNKQLEFDTEDQVMFLLAS